MSIIMRFFPNGEFVQGISTVHKRKVKKSTLQTSTADMVPVGESVSLQYKGEDVCIYPKVRPVQEGEMFANASGDLMMYLCNDVGRGIYAFEYTNGQVCVSDLSYSLISSIQRGYWEPLGLSDAPILKKPEKSRKKCLSMTKNMARNIRNAAYIMEQDYGKDNLSFLTLTLPNLSQESLSIVCSKWDTVVHKFLMWLRKLLNRKNIAPAWVYCTEIQPKRLQKRHEYAPHLHLLFRGRNGRKAPWAVTPRETRKAWVRILKSFVTDNFDTRAIENLQRIKHSAAGYLSKYMSKGNCSVPPPDSDSAGVQTLNTHWGGMSRNISRRIKSCTVRLVGVGATREIVASILQNMEEMVLAGLVKFWKAGIIPVSSNLPDGYDVGIKVGVGCLSRPTYEGGLIPCFRYAANKMRGDDYE